VTIADGFVCFGLSQAQSCGYPSEHQTRLPMSELFIESLVVGGATGFLAGLLGVGGGFLMIPLLTVMGVPIHTAVGTCLAFVACSSLTGMLQHLRQKSIDPVVALIMTLPATLMAMVSAHFSNLVSRSVLYVLFSLLLAGVVVMYHWAPATRPLHTLPATSPAASRWYVLHRQRIIRDIPYHYDFNIIKAILSGMVTGVLSGFFGIGGGVFLVPLMAVVLRVPLRVTAGTSLAVFIPPALFGAFTHWRQGNVDVGLWLPLVIAGIVGTQVGARCVVHMHPEILKRLFVLLVLAGSVFMMVKGLTE
jgi:hypothetical protein